MRPKLKERLRLVIILLLAFAGRTVAISQVPPGLSHDEAVNGVTALQVLAGDHRIFFEINKGIEPLIIYLEALAFYGLGVGPVQLRLVNIFAGLLTVALAYPLTVRLCNRRVARWAMLGLALSFWAIFVSRLTLRAVTLPPLLSLTLYLFWRGLAGTQPRAKPRLGPAVFQSPLFFLSLSGLAAGATMYTYLSSRFVPLLLAAVLLYQAGRRQIKWEQWSGLGLLCFFWALTFAPLGVYYLENRESFSRRAEQVTTIPHALNGNFGPLVDNTVATLGMFIWRGDTTDRYNLDGRPVFDAVNGLLFLLGLGLSGLALGRGAARAAPAFLLLSWSLTMLLPDFITDDSPHFLRTIGALPVVYIFWAAGLEHVRGWLHRLNGWLGPLLTFLLLAGTAWHTGYDYFVRWQYAPEARYIYGADLAGLSRAIASVELPATFPAISAEYFRDFDPFRFQLHFQNRPPFAIWFDGRQSIAFPPPQSGLRPSYYFAASAPADSAWLPFLRPAGPTASPDFERYDLADPAQLQQTWQETFAGTPQLNININDDLVLLNARVLGQAVSGGKFQVLLGWRALRTLPPETDYTFLGRMRDQRGQLWVEADGNGYAPADWQAGVLGLQLLTFRLPGDLPPVVYRLTVEVVDRRSGQALPTATGSPVIDLGPLPAQLAATPRPLDPTRLPNPIDLALTLASPQAQPSLRLRGYEVNPRTLRPGDALELSLHWQVTQPPPGDYQLSFFLTNEAETEAAVFRWPDQLPLGGEWPTRTWPAGYWFQDRLALPISRDIPAGHFVLVGQWVDGAGKAVSETFALGTIAIESG
jgi:hypothetical protein